MLRAFSLQKNGGGMHEKTMRKGKLGINRIDQAARRHKKAF